MIYGMEFKEYFITTLKMTIQSVECVRWACCSLRKKIDL